MRHVIIGAGPAGINAAREIRSLRPGDSVSVISKDEHVHSRCMLHKYISGERDERTMNFSSEDFFAQNKIEWLRGVAVTGVNAAAKTVLCDGGAVNYDKLLIATGADSVIPPIGAMRTARNVFGLRNLSDAVAIRGEARGASRVVIVGAGLVGMDAAYSLLELGKSVTVVEMMTSVMGRVSEKIRGGGLQVPAWQKSLRHRGVRRRGDGDTARERRKPAVRHGYRGGWRAPDDRLPPEQRHRDRARSQS